MKRLWTAALGTLMSMTGVCAAQAQATNSAARLQEFRVQRDAMKHGAYPGSAEHWFDSEQAHRQEPRSNAASRWCERDAIHS